jgi:hypothetical protein
MNTKTEVLTNNDGTYTLNMSVSGLDEAGSRELQDLVEQVIADFSNTEDEA